MSAASGPGLAPLPSEIASVVEELRAATERARVLYHDLGRGEAIRRWKAASWSIAECVEHLNLTTRAFLPLLDAAIADLRARNRLRTAPLRLDWMGRLLLWMSEPPARFKMPTTQPFVPVEIPDPESVYERFVDLNGQLVKRALTGSDLALDKAAITSPFNARMRYSAWSALRVLPAHERRHLWQAERVKARLRT